MANWRLGLKRTAQALAGLYCLGVAAAAFASGNDAVSSAELHAQPPYLLLQDGKTEQYDFSPWPEGMSRFDVPVSGGRRLRIAAESEQVAKNAASYWESNHAPPDKAAAWMSGAWTAVLFGGLGLAVLYGLYRAARWIILGFLTPSAKAAD